MRTLVLGLGNEMLADDAVGVLAVRALREELDGAIDVLETCEHGSALLEYVLGYDRAIVIDAFQTEVKTPGRIVELDLSRAGAPGRAADTCPGLLQMTELARRLELDFPRQFRVFAIEIADAHTVGGSITPAVRAAIPELCRRVREAATGSF